MSKITKDKNSSWGNELTYFCGFVLSLGLTMTTYLLVKKHLSTHHLYPSDKFMLVSLIFLAIIQLFVQLIFFLHLDRERKPRWNLQVMFFMLMILLIIVVGSLWIMANLNYRMADSPQQVKQYLNSQDGL